MSRLHIFRELTIKGKELANKDLRSELGYRLTVQVDVHDPARPLAVLHVPSLGNKVKILMDEFTVEIKRLIMFPGM